jgi:hypothetical protein
MKNNLLFCVIFYLLLSILSRSICQIPNGSFENWTNGNPDGWTTNNILGYLTTISQSGTVYTGNYSAKLEMMNSMLGLLQPVLYAGPLTVGIPVSQRHGTISFYYQYFPNSPSLYLLISVGMQKGGQLIGVAAGSTKKQTSSFTKLTAAISYTNSQTPDAATIYITFIDSLFNPSGVGSYALIDNIYFDQSTDVSTENISPNDFYLYQNYANPFNPNTTISWQSPVGTHQTLRVYDILGNEIATLVDEYKPAGIYNAEFKMQNLEFSSGVYFYQLRAGEFVQTKKMILLR